MPRSPFQQREPVPRLQRIPRQATSATNAEVMDIGPESAERHTTAVNSELAEDLLCEKTNRDFLEVDDVENVDTFDEYEFGISDINVKGRLKKSVEFWKLIGTCKFILDVIKEGYKGGLYNPVIRQTRENIFEKITNLLLNINIW